MIIRITEERHKATAIDIGSLDKNEQIYLSKYAGCIQFRRSILFRDEIDEIDGKKFSKLVVAQLNGWKKKFFFKLSSGKTIIKLL